MLRTLFQVGPPRSRALFRGVATPAILCHKEPCMEADNPYAIKNQRGASKKTRCDEQYSTSRWTSLSETMRTHETILYLQMVTLMGSVNSSLPKISYMKALDVRNCPHKTVPTPTVSFYYFRSTWLSVSGWCSGPCWSTLR